MRLQPRIRVKFLELKIKREELKINYKCLRYVLYVKCVGLEISMQEIKDDIGW